MLRASFMTSSSESQAIIPGAATDWVESRSGNSDKRNRNGNRSRASRDRIVAIEASLKQVL